MNMRVVVGAVASVSVVGAAVPVVMYAMQRRVAGKTPHGTLLPVLTREERYRDAMWLAGFFRSSPEAGLEAAYAGDPAGFDYGRRRAHDEGYIRN